MVVFDAAGGEGFWAEGVGEMLHLWFWYGSGCSRTARNPNRLHVDRGIQAA